MPFNVDQFLKDACDLYLRTRPPTLQHSDQLAQRSIRIALLLRLRSLTTVERSAFEADWRAQDAAISAEIEDVISCFHA